MYFTHNIGTLVPQVPIRNIDDPVRLINESLTIDLFFLFFIEKVHRNTGRKVGTFNVSCRCCQGKFEATIPSPVGKDLLAEELTAGSDEKRSAAALGFELPFLFCRRKERF